MEKQDRPKIKILTEIYTKDFPGEFYSIRFSDLPKDIQENDIIEIRRESAFNSENNSYDAYTELVIVRERDETDNEYQKRITKEDDLKNHLKQRRYETYIKLKKEFEK
jgi:hypothetical protein